MRRFALRGRLKSLFPEQAGAIEKALLAGGRIVFSPDTESYYQELELDHVFHDPSTGRAAGVRRL